ncbi:M56 family metallopeptidase [Algiphilus sp.]|uniref:M56 family metallopeptidase n=1 Tax=Algiphilus sp. TaxID=1872431 RepID=UPI003B518432
MSALATSLALALLLAAAIWWLAGALLAMLYPLLRGVVARLATGSRCRMLSAIAALPALLALSATLLLHLPATQGLGVAEHCHEGIGCGAHAPAISGGMLSGLLPLLAAGILVAALGRVLPPLRRQARRTRQLLAMAREDRGQGYAVIESDTVFTLTVGLLRPRVVVSSALLQRLEARQRAGVLLHEQAHARRRDSLRQWLAALAAPRLLSGPGRALQRDLLAACEQACDQQAAAALGDRLDVADALLTTQRRAHRPDHPVSIEAEEGMRERIAALIAPPQPERLPLPLLVIGVTALAFGAALVGLDTLHHSAERVQEWVRLQP